MLQFRMNIDPQGYREKPTAHYGEITNRLYTPSRAMWHTPEDLIDSVERGQTFTPAEMNLRTADGWISQQVICADIDNDTGEKDAAGNHVPLGDPLQPEEALAVLAEHGLAPYFMYHTFSSSPEVPRFRVVLILSEAIRDAEKVRDLSARLAAVFNEARPGCADTSTSDIRKMYLGGRPGCVCNRSGSITAIEDLEQLPELKIRRPEPVLDAAPHKSDPISGDYGRREAQIDFDIDHYDLADYISSAYGARQVRRGRSLFLNPCPICGHNDCLTVTGHIYCCHSDHHEALCGNKGGTVIQFLMDAKAMTYGEARDYFKYELDGQDPEEWKQAYRESLKTITQEKQENHMAQDKQKNIMQSFLEKIQTEAYRPYETGLAFFDRLLSGGIIRQSLLLLLAAPAAGKTTLCQQIAEALAENGKPVTYLNFEMSREQMLAKAISGRIYRSASGQLITAAEVLQGYKWTENQRAAVIKELRAYEEKVSPFLNYNPAGISGDIDELREHLKKIGEEAISAGKEAPAIVVDYLHLITSRNNIDVKETIKQAVTMLKQYAVKYDTFVIGIVAVNRSSGSSITLDSGRDSSNLEYTADYQLSLNYYDLEEGKITQNDPAGMAKIQSEKWRRMIIRVLKNRMGPSGKSAKVYFHTPSNTFFDAYGWLPADPERERIPFENQEETKRRRI